MKEDGAEIGIAFDGDADRIGVVDGNGGIVWGDHILILYARDVLARTGHGPADHLRRQVLSGAPGRSRAAQAACRVMWKTGHSLIKDKMKETRAPIAGEMSGHMFFSEGFYGHDDALYGAARLLRILADSGQTRRAELLADVPEFVSTPEIRDRVPDELKFGLVERAVAHFRAKHDVIDVDGVRVLFGDGWGLIRASNTQPVLVARYEAANDAATGGDPRRDGRLAARAGRHASDVTMRRWFVGGAGAVVAILLLAGRALSAIYADYQWYEALGAGALWRLRAGTIAAIDAGAFVVAALFAFANLYAVRHSVVSLVFPRRVGNSRSARRCRAST